MTDKRDIITWNMDIADSSEFCEFHFQFVRTSSGCYWTDKKGLPCPPTGQMVNFAGHFFDQTMYF